MTGRPKARTPVFETRDLTMAFRGGVVANSNIDLTISVGEQVCLLGPNGAGKTTLVKQLLGLMDPTSGEVLLYGAPVGAPGSRPSDHCAYLPQRPYPVQEATVEEAITLAGRLRGLKPPIAKAAALEELVCWGLEDLRRRTCGRLSGGELRLVGLACALVGPRSVLILDEPTNELDPRQRANVWSRLEALQREGRTIIVISHNVFEVEAFADRVVILRDGRVVADGAVGLLTAAVGDRLILEVPYIGAPQRAQYPTAELVDGALHVHTTRQEVRGDLALLASDPKAEVARLKVRGASLQDAYMAHSQAPADEVDQRSAGSDAL